MNLTSRSKVCCLQFNTRLLIYSCSLDKCDYIGPTIKRYVALRKEIAGVVDPVEESTEQGVEGDAAAAHSEAPHSSPSAQLNGVVTNGHAAPEEAQRTSLDPPSEWGTQMAPSATPSPAPETVSSRELLISLAQSADAISRAANEKSNVAKFAYELVRIPSSWGLTRLTQIVCCC